MLYLPSNWLFGTFIMGNFLLNIFDSSTSPLLTDHLHIQQDTVPKQQLPDTTNAALQGINPLFIMIERKTKEVEAYKKKAEQVRIRVVHKPVAPKDTTCLICPTAEFVPLHEIIEESQNIETFSFGNVLLYDKDYFKQHVNLPDKIFIETKPNATFTSTEIVVKPIVKEQDSISWLFYPILASLVLLLFLKLFFTKQILELFRSAVFFQSSKKLTRDNPFVFTQFFRLLDIALFLSLPVFSINLLEYFDILPSINISTHHIAFWVLIGLLSFRIFRGISIKIIGWTTNRVTDFDQLNINRLIYPRIFGLVLIPLNLFYLYSTKGIFLYAALSILLLILLISLLRTVRVFLNNRFSIFYLFLYLCALEIIPVLIVFKEFIWE